VPCEIGTDIQKAAQLLTARELVAIPTETVYGLAGNALNEDAILKIFKAKNRPLFDPLIVHTHAISEIEKYVTHIPTRLMRLMEWFMPGPLTVLLNRKNTIPDLITSGSDKVAFRIPNHPLTLELLRSIDFPLAAPSANPFGYISPTSAQHVYDQLSREIPYILDGGECQIGLESTIIGIDGDEVVVYRLGGMEVEPIEAIVGQVRVNAHSSSNPQAPGMLDTHYAPRKPLVLGNIEELIAAKGDKKIAAISFSDYHEADHQFILSPTRNMEEAAKRLFAAMRKMDNTDADVIYAERLPDVGLGRAINDRLQRASI
jgi:L-threonylcarbamoyladenylate synthase